MVLDMIQIFFVYDSLDHVLMSRVQGLPVGTALLDYLHDTAEMLAFSPYSKLVLTMVRAALTPYVKSVSCYHSNFFSDDN